MHPHEIITGACHCGAVQFDVALSAGMESRRRCSCSICRMRGAVAVSAKIADFNVTAGDEVLTLYQFNKNIAKHYFCSVCGIYTHHQRRSNPDEYGVNVACLRDMSPFDFDEVVVLYGSRHPGDHDGQTMEFGMLRFEKTGGREGT